MNFANDSSQSSQILKRHFLACDNHIDNRRAVFNLRGPMRIDEHQRMLWKRIKQLSAIVYVVPLLSG